MLQREWLKRIMGSQVQIQLRDCLASPQQLDLAVASVFSELTAIDSQLNSEKSHSDISRYNRGEISLRECPATISEVMTLCDLARRRTQGYFDAHLPHPHGGTYFDPTGLLIGWAMERAIVPLRDLDDGDLCFRVGNTVTIVGSEHGLPWEVPVENISNDHTPVIVVPLNRGSLSTAHASPGSDWTGKAFTRSSANQVVSVTVVGPSALWCEVYAAAACAQGLDALGWLVDNSDYQALFVDGDSRFYTTPNWEY